MRTLLPNPLNSRQVALAASILCLVYLAQNSLLAWLAGGVALLLLFARGAAKSSVSTPTPGAGPESAESATELPAAAAVFTSASLPGTPATIAVTIDDLQTRQINWLSTLSGGISHEINNPLAIIRGRADLIRRQLRAGQSNKDSLDRALLSIETNILRINRIITSLRQFGGDSTKSPIESITVQDLIQQVLLFCRERFHNHGVEVIEPAIESSCSIECRVVDIMQVFYSLLTNAFEAITENPDGTPALPKLDQWIKLEVTDEGQTVLIRVTDSGPGIAAEHQDKILVPFYSTKTLTAKAYSRPGLGKSIGMGLSLAKQIIETHHGEILLDQKSKNTCFVVRLPKKRTVAVRDPLPIAS